MLPGLQALQRTSRRCWSMCAGSGRQSLTPDWPVCIDSTYFDSWDVYKYATSHIWDILDLKRNTYQSGLELRPSQSPLHGNNIIPVISTISVQRLQRPAW